MLLEHHQYNHYEDRLNGHSNYTLKSVYHIVLLGSELYKQKKSQQFYQIDNVMFHNIVEYHHYQYYHHHHHNWIVILVISIT